MNKYKKLGLVISDGVGFRNFILTDVIKHASDAFKEVIVYSYIPEIEKYLNVSNVRVVYIPIIKEKFLVWFFRRVKEVSHLRLNRNKNFGIYDNFSLNTKFYYSKRGLMNAFITRLSFLFNSEKSILFWTHLQFKSFQWDARVNKIHSIVAKDNCDIVLFSHQRPSFISPLLFIFKELKIPNASFIFSWDNIPSKGRMAGVFDYYFVWSDLMKKELQEFYPSIMDSQILVTGTSQFDFYFNVNFRIERKDFLHKFGLQENALLILFTCGDITTSPNDELYIETLYRAILEKRFPQDIVLLVRTSPAESPKRFDQLVKRLDSSIVKWFFPLWTEINDDANPEKWALRLPTIEDLVNMRALLEYCEVNVNMCSTISLDVLHFNKPVINIAFGNNHNGLFNDQKFLSYAHFEKVVNSGAVMLATNEYDLYSHLELVFNGKENDTYKVNSLMNMQIFGFGAPSSKRFADKLLELID